MSIYKTILTKGYFPKELPPAFNTDSFANFVTTKVGRDAIAKYKPTDSFTECCVFLVPRTGNDSREIKIPHPYHFAKLSQLCAKNFSKLLRKAGASPFASSSPSYKEKQARAIQSRTVIGKLSQNRMLARAGSSYLLKADVSHFYPSLYTHAIGWAIDPKMRKKKNWHNPSILGKRIDQILMDLDRKFSQGIPIGNDISFLLGEIVLAAVDKELSHDTARSFRYFDDYEFACASEIEANQIKEKLESELAKFRLRLNPKKTEIVRLPIPTQDEWQDSLINVARNGFRTPRHLIRFIDVAFSLRENYKDVSILSFALGVLFRIRCPKPDVGRIAESAITQALLCEPGSSQKALSLLSYWKLNGFMVDSNLVGTTVSVLVNKSLTKGTHDLMWALSFCLDNGIKLDEQASAKLKEVENDIVAILALHMQRKHLLAKSFDRRALAQKLKNCELDREHWLLCYESARHGFLTSTTKQVMSNAFFKAMRNANVSFYEANMPFHASVVTQGGAPGWLIRSWVKRASDAEKSGQIPAKLRNLIQQAMAEHKGARLTTSEFRRFLTLAEVVEDPLLEKEPSGYGDT